jgi:hypothetical protein
MDDPNAEDPAPQTDDPQDPSDAGASRPRWAWWVGGGVLAVAVIVATFLLLRGDGEEPATTTASSASTTSTTTTVTTLDPSTTTSSTLDGSSSSTSASSTTAADPLPGAATTPVSTPVPVVSTAPLSDVRVAAQSGYDRVVFEFEGDRLPGYAVAYVDGPVTADPSGAPVDLGGAQALSVRMEPASGVDQTQDEARETYTGPDRLAGPPGGVVIEVVRTGDFEAVANWVVATRTRAPFRVTALTGPARLVIDIRNG